MLRGVVTTVGEASSPVVALVVGAVNTVLAVVSSFGVNLTNDQVSSIAALVNAVMALGVYLSVRASSPARQLASSPETEKPPVTGGQGGSTQ